MRKAYKYRAYLNRNDDLDCKRILGLCHELYNLCVWHREDVYAKKLKFNTSIRNTQSRMITELKKTNQRFAGLKYEIQEDLTNRVDLAYKAFFERVKKKIRPAGKPHAKKKYTSFAFRRGGYRLEVASQKKAILYVPNVGRFKIVYHRPMSGQIKTISVCLDNNRWYVSFSCDNTPANYLEKTGKSVAVDVGYMYFLTTSTGENIEFPGWYISQEKRLRKLNRRLSRKKEGSVRFKAVKKTLAKVHSKISNKRERFFYETANGLLGRYDKVYIEELKIQQMVKKNGVKGGSKRNKLVYDSAWGKFFGILQAKAAEYGKEVVRVPPEYTTKTCSQCGSVKEVKLTDSEYRCECGLRMPRKWNAATNIFNRGEAGLLTATSC